MFQSFDLMIRGGTLVNHAGRFEAGIGVTDGKIRAIGDLSDAVSEQVFDATGLTVMPGVIDSQVHFREPGNEHKEDLESGARGAVLGGVTTVFEMPNTDPLTTTPEAIKDKYIRARNRMWCDHAFYVGATADNARAMTWLEKVQGVVGIKIFMGASTGNLLVPDDETLFKILSHGSRRVAVHAEDEDLLRLQMDQRVTGDPASHARWRDEESAIGATRRLLKLARQAGRKIHVLHVTTADEMEILGRHKDIASVEVTPQHLTLHAPDCYEQLGTKAQMNPPIRDARHQAGLWRGIQDGTVDVIGSDHAPHTLAEKAKTYPESPSGMTGVQTLLPVMLTHVANGRLSLERLVDLTSAGPGRIFGLRDKGRMAVGYDADFSIVDLNKKWIIEDNWIASKAGWTPFDGFEATGKPVATLVRGHVVMREGQLASQAIGAPVRFLDMVKADMQDHEI